jgi:hypothetical protein
MIMTKYYTFNYIIFCYFNNAFLMLLNPFLNGLDGL